MRFDAFISFILECFVVSIQRTSEMGLPAEPYLGALKEGVPLVMFAHQMLPPLEDNDRRRTFRPGLASCVKEFTELRSLFQIFPPMHEASMNQK